MSASSFRYPYSHLILQNDRVVATLGPYISLFDSSSGDIMCSTYVEEPERIQLPGKKGKAAEAVSKHISSIVVDAGCNFAVTVDDNKTLSVWELDGLRLASSRIMPKKATSVTLTADGKTILVADKFGDVVAYPLHANESSLNESREAKGPELLTSHDNPFNGTLILGHVSMLTAMALTRDEQYVVTADRDEHIRVSHYPHGFHIERYCMGHLKYISALHIPPHAPSLLVSGGGDRTIRLWNYMEGTELAQLDIWETVQPFLKVQSKRRKFKRHLDVAGKGWRGKRRKEKEAAAKAQKVDGSAQRDNSMDTEEQPFKVTAEDIEMEDTEHWDPASLPSLEDVLVISKIDAIQHDSGNVLIFCAMGGTALFFAPYIGHGLGELHYHDFGVPIINFCHTGQPDELLVSLDAAFQEDDEPKISRDINVTSARLLGWTGSGFDEIQQTALLKGLNKYTIHATKKDLELLDIYGPITSLPKTEEVEEPEEAQDGAPSAVRPVVHKTTGPVKGGRTGAKVRSRQIWQEKLDKVASVAGGIEADGPHQDRGSADPQASAKADADHNGEEEGESHEWEDGRSRKKARTGDASGHSFALT